MRLKYVDSTHAYYLDGKRCKSVTSVAKIPEDTFRLEQWQQRQVAIGLAMKPSLLETIAANVDNNQKVNEICEQAQAEAGAHEGRDRGDVLHKALEQHDTGKRFIPTDLTSTAIKSWETILEEQHWRVDLVERCVLWPDQKIAGRFDRTVRGDPCPTCGKRIYIVDYKSGAKVLSYPHAISCQLTLYANAPIVAGHIPGEGGETEEFAPFEGLCTCHGYVVHLPPDSDAQLIEIDLSLSTVTDIIFPTIAWRARPAKLLARIATTVEATAPALIDDDPFAGLPNAAPAPVLNPFHDREAIREILNPPRQGIIAGPARRLNELSAAVDEHFALERQANLRQRLNWLKDNHREMAQVVASRWPEGVPNIKMPLTSDELDHIEAIVVEAERAVEAPFDPPAQEPVQPLASPSPVADLVPAPTVAEVDEGPMMEPGDIVAFKDTFADLEVEQQRRIDQWAAQAHEAGVGISMRSLPSKRRFSIGRFALVASEHHEDVVRAVLALAIGDDDIQTVVTTGSVLGVLTQEEAERAWELVLSLGRTRYYDAFTKRLVAA